MGILSNMKMNTNDQKYDLMLIIIFIFIMVNSIFNADKKGLLWAITVSSYLISTKLLKTNNTKLLAYESILFLIGSIILFLSTFTDLIGDISPVTIIIYIMLYLPVIFLKMKLKDNKIND